MGWTAVVNPSAGRGRVARLVPRLTRAFATLPDGPIDVHVSDSLDDAEAAARRATAVGRSLVAVGGDGTVAAIAGIAAEHDATLAIVPAGAGNDFARTVGIDPRRPLDAIGVLRAGTELRCDLGRVNGRWFTSVANTGFDSEANRWANTVTRVSGTTLYVLAVLRTLAVYRPHRFRLRVDEGPPTEYRAWLLAVGNGSTYAGGMRIAPAADLTDGQLDVTLVGPVSRAEFLRSFPRVFRGTHVSHPAVTVMRGRSIEIESLDDSVPIECYASGERIGPLPATIEIVPGALRLRVPSPSAPGVSRP